MPPPARPKERPFRPVLPDIEIRLHRPPEGPDKGVPGTIDGDLGQVYLRNQNLERLGGDVTALRAMRWDSLETRPSPDGGQQVIGRDDLTGFEAVIQSQTAEEAEKAPAMSPEAMLPPEAMETEAGAAAMRDIPRGILHGANTAAQELTNTIPYMDELADWLGQPLPPMAGDVIAPWRGLGEESEYALPQTTAGQVIAPIAQFATGTAVIAPAAPLRALGAMGGFLRWTVTGGLVDFAFFSPDEPGMAGLLQDLGQLDDRHLERARQVFIDGLAKDEDDSEIEKRLKNVGEGAIIGGTFDGLMALYRAARAAGKSGALREFFTSETGAVLPQDNPLARALGEEKMRLHRLAVDKQRLGGRTGIQKNADRPALEPPEGSDLPPWPLGVPTTDQWLARTERFLSPEEIAQARTWYRDVYEEFERYVGEDRAADLMFSWLISNQNVSPSGALFNALRVMEQMRSTQSIDIGKKAGLTGETVATYLSGDEVSAGVGIKIIDFTDAALGKTTRSAFDDDPLMGAPAVVDVQSLRDMGFMDEPLRRALGRLGYDTAGLPLDFRTTISPSPAQYERAADQIRRLTEELNARGWQGGDLTPAEVQAIGWTTIGKTTSSAESPGEALARNLRRLSYEVDFGEGSPLARAVGDGWAALPALDKTEMTETYGLEVMRRVNERYGITGVHALQSTGGWRGGVNPNIQASMLATPERLEMAANAVGYLLNQTEVLGHSVKPMTLNPKGFAVEIVEDGTGLLKDQPNIDELWRRIQEADTEELFGGFSMSRTVDGQPGMSLIVGGGKKNQRAVGKFLEENNDIFDGLPYDVTSRVHEAEVVRATNDWTEVPDGQAYLHRLREIGGSGAVRGLVGERTELEKSIKEAVKVRVGERAREAGVSPKGFIQRFLEEEFGGGPNPFEMLFPQLRAERPFFSKALQAIGDITTNKASPDQWRAALRKAGTKQEELDWIGLDEFLAGKKSVTKAEVEEFVRTNQVEVREVEKAGAINEDDLDNALQEAEAERLLERFSVDFDEEEGVWQVFDENGSIADGFRTEDEAWDILHQDTRDVASQTSREDLMEYHPNIAEQFGAGDATKFAEWTLPGGENYKELLLTLPERDLTTLGFGAEKRGEYSRLAGIDQFARTIEEQARFSQLETELKQRRLVAEVTAYRGGHFDEPNVLAHIRFNERTDAGGNKVLFIEEIQSDWHQKGRKEGYAKPLKREDLQAERVGEGDTAYWNVTDDQGNFVGRAPGSYAEDRALDAFVGGQAAAVPDAPFKKTWHELSLKRMLRWAAENDFDRIAWTTGKQQVERYKSALRKAVDELRWTKTEEGVHLQGLKGGGTVADTTYKEDQLTDALGKVMGEKILADEGQSGVIRGDDITIDDIGMAGFYDKMIPRFLAKFTKKWDGKVTQTQIKTDPFESVTEVPAETIAGVAEHLAGQGHEELAGRFYRASSLAMQGRRPRDVFEELTPAELERHLPEAMLGRDQVHVLEMTPKMKTTAMEKGMPLFSAGGIGAGLLINAAAEGEAAEGGRPGEVQTAGIIDKIIKPLIGKAGREALEHPPKPKPPVKPPGVDEILEIYQPYHQGSPEVEGIDFNMTRIETSDQAKEIINEVSEAYAGKITARTGGVVPHELTRQVADLLGTDPEAAMRAVQGLPSDVSNLHIRALTMRDMLVASSEEADRLAYQIAKDPAAASDNERLVFYEHLARHASLQANMKGVQTEIARALSAFRISTEAPTARRAQMVKEALQAGGGTAKADELAKLWLQTPLDKRGKIVAESLLSKSVGALREVWINGLLSGFRTHTLNFVSNQLFTGWQIPERGVAGLIGGARRQITGSQEGVRPMEAIALLHGWTEGFPEALRLGWTTFRTGEPSSGLSKIEHVQHQNISAARWDLNPHSLMGRFVDLVGMGVRIPGRFLISADEFQKGLGRAMERRALAYRFAQEEMAKGASTQDSARIYADIIEGRHAVAEEQIEDFADTITFTRKLGEAGQAIQKTAARVPFAWLLAPFIRTPTNIIKEFGKRSPLALLHPGIVADIAAGGARSDLALARISTGTAAIAWAAHLAAQGEITGGGPTDPRMRKIWLQKYSPYSVKIGDKWYPYGRLEPVGMIFGVGADLVEYQTWAPRDIADQAAPTLYGQAVGAILHRLGDKTFFTGLSEFARAWEDPDRYADNYIKRMAGSFVPFSTMVRDVESAIDPARSDTAMDPYEDNPYMRHFRGILNEWRSRTPGMNAGLPDRLNMWGEEVVAYEGPWLNAFNLFTPRSDKAQPIDEEMLRVGYALGMPRREISGVKLNPWQYHTLVKTMNEIEVPHPSDPERTANYRETLNWLVTSTPYLTQLNDEKRVDMLRDVRRWFLEGKSVNGVKVFHGAKDRMLTPGSPQFDAELFSYVAQARVMQPLGLEFQP